MHKKFGKIPLKTFPVASMIKYKILYEFLMGMKRIYPLDYINYNKEEVEKILKEKFNWQKYENKHYENVFTRFYEGHYLVKKINFDKRRCYLSNLILTKQITREEGLKIISTNPYDNNLMEKDKKYIAKKLDFSIEEFDSLINQPGKSYKDYGNSYGLLISFVRLAQLLGIEKREFR